MVLIGCGLSLEGVAGVDQEGPPGEGAAKAGLDRKSTRLNSSHNQEGRRGSDEVAPGPSVFPSRDPSVSGNFF